MQIEKMSSWITVTTNLGLLLGVILVIFQINQNSELVREQIDHASWSDNMNLHLAMMGDNPAAAVAKAIENPSELMVEDTTILNAYLTYWALAEVREIYTYARGMQIVPPSSFTSDDRGIALHRRVLGNAYAKARFEDGFGPSLTPRMQSFMDSLSGNEALEEHERMIGRIKEAK